VKVDLNCDMGESFGVFEVGNDEEIMPYITSANIACGFHGGDPVVIRRSVELAKKYNVQIGAHPSFPDLMGFGRRFMNCTPSEIKNYIIYQLGALREFAKIFDIKIQHCKPHGALYMHAMEDEQTARAILEAIAEIEEEIIVFALNHSAVEYLGNKMGIPIALEAYADREHTKSGSIVLTRRGEKVSNYNALADRVVRMIKEQKVITNTGEDIDIKADTICIHSDTPGASLLTKTIFNSLVENNIKVESLKL